MLTYTEGNLTLRRRYAAQSLLAMGCALTALRQTLFVHVINDWSTTAAASCARRPATRRKTFEMSMVVDWSKRRLNAMEAAGTRAKRVERVCEVDC
jgi:hypothetical protein